MPLLVHLIDFSARNPWIEDQMVFFERNGIQQGLITISASGEINEAAIKNGFEKVQHIRRSVSGFVHSCSLVRKWSKSEKVYIFAHGHLASIYASFIQIFTGINFIICHHQQPEFFAYLRIKSYFRAFFHLTLTRFYLIQALKIQSFSPEVTRSLIRKKINPDKIVEIPLGIDFRKFYKVSKCPNSQETRNSFRIVSVSRLVWEKRLDLGIRSVKHLLERGVLVDYSIVGEGPEYSNLANLVDALGIATYVKFLGRREDVNEILNSADILLHLSLTESYGQVLVEARLAGTPIFSSACGVALEMQKLEDPMVYVSQSSDPGIIADEFLEYLKQLEEEVSLETVDPRFLYQHHEYSKVLENLEILFRELFNGN